MELSLKVLYHLAVALHLPVATEEMVAEAVALESS
jgi:hypothetical protein